MHMLFYRQPFLFLFAAIASIAGAQSPEFTDTIHSNGPTGVLEVHFDMPLGQMFVSGPSNKPGISGLKCYSSASHFQAQRSYRVLGSRRIIFYSPKQDDGTVARQSTGHSGDNTYSYRISNASINDVGNVIWEFFPDPAQTHSLFIQSGMGGSRLDLSGLKISGLNVSSGASDIVITYSQPNKTEMDVFEVNGGMGKIQVRNIEMARAKKIHIQNGMGETQISIGTACTGNATEIRVEVGAGNCVITADSQVPMKIVINKSFLSSVHIPESFIKSGENVYTNPKFKTSENQSVVIIADIGVGDFTFLPSGK